jgi:hypothetical protein
MTRHIVALAKALPELFLAIRDEWLWVGRMAHSMWASRFGYFWMPCPICDVSFGGHQWKTSTELPGEIRHPTEPFKHIAICPRCRKAGRGQA